MKRYLLVIFIFLQLSALAQEGQFSQYFASSSFVNPAFSGTIPSMNFSANYKRAGDPEDQSYQELMQATFTYPLRKETSEIQQFGSIGANVYNPYISGRLLFYG